MTNLFDLKPYQMASAEQIFRAYCEQERQTFVLADEAGMGKTYVALQTIAALYLKKRQSATETALEKVELAVAAFLNVKENLKLVLSAGTSVREDFSRWGLAEAAAILETLVDELAEVSQEVTSIDETLDAWQARLTQETATLQNALTDDGAVIPAEFAALLEEMKTDAKASTGILREKVAPLVTGEKILAASMKARERMEEVRGQVPSRIMVLDTACLLSKQLVEACECLIDAIREIEPAMLEARKVGFNVYYMCSNARILNQNGEKLKGHLASKFAVQNPECDRLSVAFSLEKSAGVNLFAMSASLLDDSHSSGARDEVELFLAEHEKEMLKYLQTLGADKVLAALNAAQPDSVWALDEIGKTLYSQWKHLFIRRRAYRKYDLARGSDIKYISLVKKDSTAAEIPQQHAQVLENLNAEYVNLKKALEAAVEQNQDAENYLIEKLFFCSRDMLSRQMHQKYWEFLSYLEQPRKELKSELPPDEETLFRNYPENSIYSMLTRNENLPKEQLRGLLEELKNLFDIDSLNMDGEEKRQAFGEVRSKYNQRSVQENPPDLIVLDEFHRMDMGEQGDAGNKSEQTTRGLQALNDLVSGKEIKLLYLSATPYPFSREEQEQSQKKSQTQNENNTKKGDEEQETFTAFSSFSAFVEFFGGDVAENTLAAWNAHQACLDAIAANPSEDTWKQAAQKANLLGRYLRTFMSRSERGRIARQTVPEELTEPQKDLWKDSDLLRWMKDWTEGNPSYLKKIPGVYSYAIKHNNKRNPKNQRYQELQWNHNSQKPSDFLWESKESGLSPEKIHEDVSPFRLQPLEERKWNYNAQLHAIDLSVVQGREQLLWVPPIIPYYRPEENSVYGKPAAKDYSKLLIFSNYQYIPRAVGSLFSQTVLQRNQKAAGTATLPENWLADVLNSKVYWVRYLAEKVPYKRLRQGGKQEELLSVKELVDSLVSDTGLPELLVWQAIGSPQVCLWRIIGPHIQGIREALPKWADKMAGDFLLWASEENIAKEGEETSGHLDPARLLWRKDPNKQYPFYQQNSRLQVQTRMKWEWYFSQNGSSITTVSTNTLGGNNEKKKFAGRSPQSSIWLWITTAGKKRMEEEAGTKGFLDLFESIQSVFYGKTFATGPARKLTSNLQLALKTQLKYTDSDPYSWTIPESDEAVADLHACVKDSFLKTMEALLEEYTAAALSIFKGYFQKEAIQWALVAAGVKNRDDLFRYCANGNLQSVLDEFLFLCDDNPWKLIKTLNTALNVAHSQVYILTQQVEEAKLKEEKLGYKGIASEKKRKQLPHVTCHFSERYTDDFTDTHENINEKRQSTMQDAFNSPFWPMVLTTTSVAQEGLDFHQYCRKIMHYTLPHTPMALEQREGRIDRYHGYIQRLRQAKHHPGLFWSEMFEKSVPGTYGVVPDWVVNPEKGDSTVERILGFVPGTEDAIAWNRLLCAKRQYRNMIGMPEEFAQMEQLLHAEEQINAQPNGTIVARVEDLFPDLTPIHYNCLPLRDFCILAALGVMDQRCEGASDLVCSVGEEWDAFVQSLEQEKKAALQTLCTNVQARLDQYLSQMATLTGLSALLTEANEPYLDILQITWDN